VGGGQYAPIGSDHYLVWSEGGIKSNGGPIYGSFDVRALDLRTNKVITVTNEPGDQGGAALAGDLVAWQSYSYGCTSCREPGVYATDLARGTVYTVSTGNVAQTTIGVSGRKVAWVEVGATGKQIKIKDLDTDMVAVVREVVNEEPEITGLQMSGNFLVWNEIAYNYGNIQNNVSYVKAYDLTTDKTSDVYIYVMSPQTAALVNYALDGHLVIVQGTDGTIFTKDLASNLELEFDYKGFLTDVKLHGDLVLFSSSPSRSDIKGINLNRPNVIVPIIDATPGSTAQYEFTIAGGRLVYVNASADPNRQDRIVLHVLPLPDALK
jgi:hypothetical protein